MKTLWKINTMNGIMMDYAVKTYCGLTILLEDSNWTLVDVKNTVFI